MLVERHLARPTSGWAVIGASSRGRRSWRAALAGQEPEAGGSEPSSSLARHAQQLDSDASSRAAQLRGGGDRASSSGSDSGSEASSGARRRSLWTVPWSGWEATRFVALIYAANATAPALVAAAARAAQGLGPGELPPDEQEYLSLVTQLLQLASTAWLLRAATAAHRPLPRRWFDFRTDSWALMSGGAGAVAALGGVVLLAAVLLQAQSDGVVLASALLFASAHPAGAFVPEVLLGCVFGTALFAARGSLAAPLIAHAAYNGAVLTAALLLSSAGGAGGGVAGGGGG